MPQRNRPSLIVVLGFALVVVMFFMQPKPPAPSLGQDGQPSVLSMTGRSSVLPYSDFLAQVRSGRIRDVVIRQDVASGFAADGVGFLVALPENTNVADRVVELGGNVRILQPEPPSAIMGIVVTLLPMVVLIGFWLFMMRRMQGGGANGPMSFGKSRARMFEPSTATVTFEDVAGADEAREELVEVVDFLRDPERFLKLGARIPRGVLLVGPPGTGKTLLAKAVAGEAGVNFFSISGADFVEMFVGVGASRVRDMFAEARKHAPCIIFIDEIDAMGRHRGAGVGGGNDEREQTLNQMLVEMDGFSPNLGIILIAATNRPDVLDPALLRPGRFDRQVTLPNPDVSGREKILAVHARKVRLGTVDLRTVARGTPGFSGADLANLVNEAALMAARRRHPSIEAIDFEAAKDRILMGNERKSLRITPEDRRLTAYHEAGHAFLGSILPGCDPVHKATIVPRGRALGMVVSLPEGDQVSMSRAKVEDQLVMAMGGRATETIVFGHANVTSGASSDIAHVTSLARRMVTEWGFSDLLGPIRYTDNQAEVFLGHSVARQQNMSEDTAKLIDSEIKRIVMSAEAKAVELITMHRDRLEALAQALLERETLDGDQVRILSRGGLLPPIEVVLPAEAVSPISSSSKRGSVPTTGTILPAVT